MMKVDQKSHESISGLAMTYIGEYPNVDDSAILMKWNGQRGVAFDDTNQGFREQVIRKVLKDPNKTSMALVYQLMHEEANWASKTLTFRYYLPELLEMLMVNVLGTYEENIVRTFTENPYALKCIVDLKVEDRVIEKWLTTLERSSKRSNDASVNYGSLIGELNMLLKTRRSKREDVQAFEAYVTHRDPFHVAVVNQIKDLWQHGETTWLALFFIVPLTLLMGYYFFGFAILYGMLPVFRALIVLYGIYKIANWVVR